MYLIAGLGNPGLKYRHTRHNAGFDAIDLLAKKYSISLKQKKFLALYGDGRIGSHKVALLKPQTYMNRSGESVFMAASVLNIEPDTELLVLVDDIALDYGMIRIRKQGSAGGHNGLKNIISCIHSENFARIRIGVGMKPPQEDLADYVTSRPPKAGRLLLGKALEDTVNAVEILLSRDIDTAMNTYNGKQKSNI